MAGDTTSVFKGEDSAQLAQTVLESCSNDETRQVIEVKITTIASDSKTHPTIPTSGDGDSRSRSATLSTTSSTAPVNENDSIETTTESREEGEIVPNTSHHHVLHFIARHDDNDSIPGRDVKSQITSVSEGSVFPALTQLWERKLVERERVKDVPNPYYKYKVSDYGEITLAELGTPSLGAD